MNPDLAAALFAVLMVLIFAVGFGALLWLGVSEQIDQATTLPRPDRGVGPADDDTARIDPVLIPHDLPRIREDHWL